MKTLDTMPGKTPPPEPGVYYGIPNDEYHGWGALNHSTLNGFFESTAKGVHEIESRKESCAFDFGNAFHARLLEPDRYKSDYVVFTDDDAPINPKTGKMYGPTSAKYQDWKVEFESGLEDSQSIISDFDARRIESMIKSVKSNRYAVGFATAGHKKREMSIVWDEMFVIDGEEIMVRCKARIDLFIDKLGAPINMPAMLDLKTTDSANYDDFQRAVWKWGYHRQMAWYLRGLHKVGLMPQIHDHSAMILACEKKAPFQSAIYYIDSGSIAQGLHEHKENATKYIKWRLTGEVPGLPPMPRPIQIPAWQRMSESEITTTKIDGEML